MALRATYAKVILIIPTDVLEANINEYIVFANQDIDAAVALSAKFAALGTAMLTSLENLLAAHYTAAFADPRSLEEKRGGSEDKWQRATGLGFDSTPFGQMAIRRDPTGTLKEIAAGGTNAVESSVLGIG